MEEINKKHSHLRLYAKKQKNRKSTQICREKSGEMKFNCYLVGLDTHCIQLN